MVQVNEHIQQEVVKVKIQDQVDEFQLGLNEDKLLYLEDYQN
jgi:hypothetical protein